MGNRAHANFAYGALWTNRKHCASAHLVTPSQMEMTPSRETIGFAGNRARIIVDGKSGVEGITGARSTSFVLSDVLPSRDKDNNDRFTCSNKRDDLLDG